MHEFSVFIATAQQLELKPAELASQIGISERTMERRSQTNSLNEVETIKVSMVRRILEQATRILGGEGAASLWMKSAIPALDSHTPLELLTSIDGYERVRSILGRLASGTF
jgi:putative toxin-antitoxin system antitoxin component (TIGR02293 family)